MKSPNGTSNRVAVLIPHRSVTVTTLCPLKYPASSGLFCNGGRCGRQSFPGRTLKRRDRQERWQAACNILKPAALLTSLIVRDEGAGEGKKKSLIGALVWNGAAWKLPKSERQPKDDKGAEGSYTNSLTAGQTQISNYLCPSHLLSTKNQGLFTHPFNIFWWNT